MYSEGNEEENNYDLDDDSLKRKKRSTKNGKGFGRNTGNGKWGASQDKYLEANFWFKISTLIQRDCENFSKCTGPRMLG